MADNYTATQGSGTTFASDDISSVHYPRIKIKLGADGAADCDLDSGQQTMANSVPVVTPSDNGSTETLYNAQPADNAVHTVDAELEGARALGFYYYNNTSQDVTIKIYLYTGLAQAVVYSESLATGTQKVVAPGAGGTGAHANYEAIPALSFPVFNTVTISYQMPAGVAGGNLRIDCGRLI